MGKLFVYAREDRDRYIAYSHAMGRDIPQHDYYVDKPGEWTQLTALLRTVQPGDTVIVGTVYDFMETEIVDMLDTLENLNDDGVHVESRMQPDYNIALYRVAMRLAIEMDEVKGRLKSN